MNIAGKLFGSIGHATSAAAAPRRTGTTACPGFCWWYSAQMAKSYEIATRRASAA